jgi:hypothetical protein
MSMSNTRLSSRAQVARTGLLCAWRQSPSPAVVCGAGFGTTFARSFAFGAGTP